METQTEPRPNAKRKTILDAAMAAFRDDGYESASMDRIAELAGASKRTVYNHFGSKEALFQAIAAASGLTTEDTLIMEEINQIKGLGF